MVKTPSLHVLGRMVPLWAVALAFVALGLIAYSPYLSSGFAADDFIFINMLEGAIPYDPVLGFWYGEMDSYPGFTLLWWTEPGVEGAFLRPLASWTLTLLYRTFGRNAVPFHAALVVVHALGAFTAFLVLRRLSGRDAPALLAALLFLVCEDHGMTVAWIATITDLLCLLFLNLAFLCYIIARQERTPPLFGLSLALFLAAIASKETAAVYPVIVAAYEFFFADRLSAERVVTTKRQLRDRVRLITRFRLFFRHWWAWAIPLAVLAAYMTFYRSLVPPMRSLLYRDPFSQPVHYLSAMLINLPVMFVGLLTQFLPSLVSLMPETLPFVAGAGVILMALLVWALLPYRRQRGIWFALVVFVLGLLPGLATEAGERLLYFPSVYGLFIVAWLILQIPACTCLHLPAPACTCRRGTGVGAAQVSARHRCRRGTGGLRQRFTPDAPPGVRVLGPVWGWYLMISALITPVILLFIYPSMWIPGLQLPEQTILDSLPLIDEGDYEHVVYLNTNSSFNTFYLPDIYRYHRGEYMDLRLLSSFNGHIWAMQEAERALVLKTEDPGWLNNMFARIVRVTPGFAVGDVYTTPLFTATILAVTPEGQDVQEIRFEFVLPLDDPSLGLLYYDGQIYRHWEPSPEWELLNPTLDPFAF
jgi:hypothetical protein